MNAHDALRTDWTDIDPRNRPAPYSEAPATISCGLLAKLQRKGRGPNQLCEDRFYSELGRELHHTEEHRVGLALVEAPAVIDGGTMTGGGRRQASPPPVASTCPAPRRAPAGAVFKWRQNPLSGQMQKVRVR